MPDDDEDEYEEDGAEEMVDMEDDEAHENDQLQANKVGGTALMGDEDEEEHLDENAELLPSKKFASDPSDALGSPEHSATAY